MKNAKKIGIVLLAVILVMTAVVIASVAEDDVKYTGTVTDFNALVDAVPADGAIADRETALNAVGAYLTENPVDPEAEGYDNVVSKYKAKMAAIASLYVDSSVASTGADAKAAQMTLAEKWAALAFVTDDEKASDAAKELYAKIYPENLVIAKLYYDAIEVDKIDIANVSGVGNVDAAVAATQVKRMKSYVASHTFDNAGADYTDFMKSYDQIVAKADAAKEARYQALLFKAKLDEYGLGVAVNFNFEVGSGTPAVSTLTGTVGGVEVSNTVSTDTEVVGVDEQGNEIKNSYRTLRWNAALSSYFNLSYSAATDGMVIEFDLTTFDKLPTSGIGFQPYAGSSWMNITSDGTFYGYGAAKAEVGKIEGAIVPGEWSRITYIYNPNDRAHCELYLDYVFLGYVHGDTGNKGTVASALRMGNTKSTGGSFSIDNVTCTRGTAIRDERYIAEMTSPELVIYYSGYMQSEDIPVPNRIQAYEEFKKLLGAYADVDEETGEVVVDKTTGEISYKPFPSDMKVSADDLKAAIVKYTEYDVDVIIEDHSRSNLAELRKMIDVLAALVPSHKSSSLTERSNQLKAINTFMELNGEYIYDDSNDAPDEFGYKDDYNYCMTVLSDVTTRHETDTLIHDFVNAMAAFRDATSVYMLNSKYSIADNIVSGGLDITLNAEQKIENYKKLSNTKKYVDSVNYVIDAYPSTSEWKLYPIVRAEKDWTAEQINDLNAKYSTSIVAPALEWDSETVAKLNESLEYDLLTEWTDEKIASNKEAYDYLFNYAIMIRGYAAAGVDESYYGYSAARDKVEDLLNHYYGVLQANHADVIREQLDRFAESNAFIEKQGLLSYIERYMNENDVDLDNAEIQELMIRYEAYKSELPPQESDYAELLAQNTVYFINLSKQFGSAITYAQKRDLYDRATPYYYAMNVGTEEAQAAVALYDALTLELKVVEDASAGLIEAVMLLPTALDADTYFNYLVDAALCYDIVDASIEGVADAMKSYEAVRDAYNLKVNTDNAQLLECGDALGSLRANCGLSAIISVIIAKLYSFR